MEKDVQQFQEDLLKSVRQMKRGDAARTTTVRLSPVVKARASVQMNQQELADLSGIKELVAEE